MSSILDNIESHFEPVWSEAIHKAGWEWDSVNNWWDLPIYCTDWLESMTYVSLRSTVHVPKVLFARLRNVPYYPNPNDKQYNEPVLDFIIPTYPYQAILYSSGINKLYETHVTDMSDLTAKLVHVVKLIKEEWKVPERYFKFN